MIESIYYKDFNKGFVFKNETTLHDFYTYSDLKQGLELPALLDTLLDSTPEPYHVGIRNLVTCGYRVASFSCPSCNHVIKKPSCCHSVLCNDSFCSDERRALASARLHKKGIRSERLYHFTFGSNKLSRKQLQKSLRRFFSFMRKQGFKLFYVKVLDTNRKGYLHYHIACLPEKILANAGRFVLLANSFCKKSRGEVLFHNIGYRRKKSLFSYFAKRGAGILGHYSDRYYYADLFSIPTFFKEHYRAKRLSCYLPVGLACKEARSYPQHCPKCSGEMVFCGYEDAQELTDLLFPTIPPPKSVMKSENVAL